MKQPKILLLNGPPGSGKDTIANMLDKQFHPIVKHEKLSKPLKMGLATMFGLSPAMLGKFENNKEKPQPILNGLSWRQAQIKLFKHLEDVYGSHILGELLAQRIMAYTNGGSAAFWFVISDSGYSETEVTPLVERFGRHAVKHVIIRRPGYEFGVNGDYRREMDLKERFGIVPFVFENRFDMEMLELYTKGWFKQVSGYESKGA